MNSKVTVQLLGWNHAKDLRRTLLSYRDFPREIVRVRYVDNASADNSIAIVKEMIPDADVLQLDKNYGYAGGHNRGLERCETPFVLLVNADTELRWPGVIELLEQIENNQQVGAAQGLLYRDRSRDIVDSAGIALTPAVNGHERGAGEGAADYTRATQIIAPTGACAMYRLDALQAVAEPDGSYFDEAFFAYKEDIDLGWRLWESGWQVWFWPIDVGQHVRALRSEGHFGWSLRPAAVWQRLAADRTRLSFRNWIWLIIKHVKGWDIVWRSPFIVGRLTVWATLSLLYWPFWRVWREALIGIPKMIDKRRISQAL